MTITTNRLPDIYTACEAVNISESPSGAKAENWRWQTSRELETLRQSLAAEAISLDSRDGLYSQLTEDSPHLAASIERLRRERLEVTERINKALEAVCSSVQPSEPAGLEALKAQVHDTICHATTFQRHVHGVTFDAYDVDLGGPG